jgi:Uma2 family endonuclease
MSATILMPVEEYLRLTEKPYCEYREGAVSPKAMPTKFHAIIQYALLMLLRAQGVQALPELTVRISPTRYLVPDVSVAGDFPGPYPTLSCSAAKSCPPKTAWTPCSPGARNTTPGAFPSAG